MNPSLQMVRSIIEGHEIDDNPPVMARCAFSGAQARSQVFANLGRSPSIQRALLGSLKRENPGLHQDRVATRLSISRKQLSVFSGRTKRACERIRSGQPYRSFVSNHLIHPNSFGTLPDGQNEVSAPQGH